MTDKKDEGGAVAQTLKVVEAYQEAFSTPAGRIVLEDLARFFGFASRSMADHPDEIRPYVLAYREGQRSVVVHIGNRLETDPASVEETATVQM